MPYHCAISPVRSENFIFNFLLFLKGGAHVSVLRLCTHRSLAAKLQVGDHMVYRGSNPSWPHIRHLPSSPCSCPGPSFYFLLALRPHQMCSVALLPLWGHPHLSLPLPCPVPPHWHPTAVIGELQLQDAGMKADAVYPWQEEEGHTGLWG